MVKLAQIMLLYRLEDDYNLKEVIMMEQKDLNTISEIVAKYGYIEWTLIGFTPAKDYDIFSYFTDPAVLPVFKVVLLSILRTLEGYLEKYEYSYDRTLQNAGTC